MVLVCLKLTKDALTEADLTVDNFILSGDPQDEKYARISIRKFIETLNGEDKLLVFADQRSDKLGILRILKDECNKAGIELSISLYCKNTNPEDEEYDSYFFREVDLDSSEELKNMAIW